ncbi:site-specific integrase [Bordetella bronchiseptica]|uniref:site-specific integrase n=1 Tax=Bordetella hinzii TaxID=103855 RepID=UPI0009B82304|nr:site-specific integrase [Bordetella hinzii]
MHRLPNLWKSRHGVYYFRYYENGTEVKRSLFTKDWHRAKLLAFQLHLARDMTIRKFDVELPNGIKITGINSDEDVSRLERLSKSELLQFWLDKAKSAPSPNLGEPFGNVPAGQPTASPAKLKTDLFLSVVKSYINEKRFDNSEKTLKEKRSTYDEFARLFGNVDTNSITTETAISYKNKLISDGLGAQRINKTISFMKDFFVYAINHKRYMGANPFEGLTISSKSKLHQGKKSYYEFTDEELSQVFENSKYSEYLNKPDYYWLPFLGLYTGARIEELASLTVPQLKQTNGIWYFSIEKGKNSNSIREIPLHHRIVDSKFIQYVEKLTDKNGLIFPHLKPSINGYSKNASRRFGDYLDLVGISDERKVFHSFRSTFINRMTYLNIHPAIIMGIVGHYEQSKIDFSSAHFTTYQQKKPIEILKKSIDLLEYPIKILF